MAPWWGAIKSDLGYGFGFFPVCSPFPAILSLPGWHFPFPGFCVLFSWFPVSATNTAQLFGKVSGPALPKEKWMKVDKGVQVKNVFFLVGSFNLYSPSKNGFEKESHNLEAHTDIHPPFAGYSIIFEHISQWGPMTLIGSQH